MSYGKASQGGGVNRCGDDDTIEYAVEPGFSPSTVPIGQPGCGGFGFGLLNDAPCFAWQGTAPADASTSALLFGCLQDGAVAPEVVHAPSTLNTHGHLALAFDSRGLAHLVGGHDGDQYATRTVEGEWTWQGLAKHEDWQMAVAADGQVAIAYSRASGQFALALHAPDA